MRAVFQDDYKYRARKIPKQMAVVYEPVPPKRRTRTWTQERIDAESGTLSIHESLIALKLENKYKKQFDYYVRLNGYSSTVDYAQENEDIDYEELTGSGLRQWRDTQGSKPAPPVAVTQKSLPPTINVLRDRRPNLRSDVPVQSTPPNAPALPRRQPIDTLQQPRRSEQWMSENAKQLRRFHRTSSDFFYP